MPPFTSPVQRVVLSRVCELLGPGSKWLPPKPTLKNALVIPELSGSARKTEFFTQSASSIKARDWECSSTVSPANRPR
eukprot:939287-Prymnesium_polylepis.1